MRPLLPVIIVILLFCGSQARSQQWVAVPDPAFRAKLMAVNGPNLGGCFNGTQDSIDALCPAVVATTHLDIYSPGSTIVSLEGIEAFQNLTHLICGASGLINLGNLPSSLHYLVIGEHGLTTLPGLPAGIDTLSLEIGSLTSIPNLPTSLTYMEIYDDIGSVPVPAVWPASLKHLYLWIDGNMPTLPPALENLVIETGNISNLTNIPPFPSTLKELNIVGTAITSLPSLSNTSLLHLTCGFVNSLTSLPALPGTLKGLFITFTPLTALPSLPNSLDTIVIQDPLFTTLPSLPTGLKYLDVGYGGGLNFSSSLTTLPSLPSTLEYLSCGYSNLNSLPVLPPSLKYLDCPVAALTSLPALPSTLEFLSCGFNAISVLPTLPASLKILNCDHLLITSIPTLPATLEGLNASFGFGSSGAPGQLTSLPTLPSGLLYLNITGNQISTLPELSSVLNTLIISGNPISCMPQLPNVMHSLYFDNTQIQCLPNSVVAQNASPSLVGVPICDTGNANNCPIYWNVKGATYLDADADCSKSVGDQSMQHLKVDVYKNGLFSHMSITNLEGDYATDALATDAVTIQVDTTGLPFALSCGQADTNFVQLTVADSLSTDEDFSFGCGSGFDLAAQAIAATTCFRNAHYTNLMLFAGSYAQFYGVNVCSAPVGIVTAKITGPSHAISGSPVPTYISPAGDSLVWNAVDFYTSNLMSPFNITMLTDTFAAPGSHVCVNLTVTPTSGDINTVNNTKNHCFSIFNSYDPNDKEVSPVGNLTPGFDDWLTYTVRFQNTGNADAINIRVRDTLSSLLDPSTFQLLAYSFSPAVTIDDHVVEFDFNNINLPDSFSNEPGSHGFVQYRIKPVAPGLPTNVPVNNTAYIYFDFNPAVVTNTVTSTACGSLVTASVGVSASPGATVCTGTPVSFTAVPVNGGTAPEYQWLKNGISTGMNGAVYTTGNLSNNDVISCVLTSNAQCLSSPTAASNAITMTVNPGLTPSVGISSAQGDSVCVGTVIDLTANTLNTGLVQYQWINNSVTVGTNSPTYSFIPADGDSISCIITTSGSCLTSNNAVSNSMILNVAPLTIPAISINGPMNASIGSTVTINASLTNAPASYSVDWKNHWLLFSTTTTPSVSYTKAAGTDTITATVTTTDVCYDLGLSNEHIVSVITGINELNSFGISVYPNPFEDAVTITGLRLNDRIICTDVTGKTNCEWTATKETQSLKMTALAPGHYVLKITDARGVVKVNVPVVRK